MTVPKLPRRQRELFTLVYVHPRTLTEAATAAGMSASDTLKTLDVLTLKNLVERRGRYYLPARWVLEARQAA